MRIGLIDVDGHNYPNLPLMKLSAWHKAQGHSVEWYNPLFSGHMDRVYMSKVFTASPEYEYYVDADEIVKGGTGYSIQLINGREVYNKEADRPLPYDVEHIYPDYEIYNVTDTAYGFLTRGCPRACGFCHVASKEGRRSYKVANLDEFWRGQKNIILYDPNILACADHMELLNQLAQSGARVEFNQGLDIRFLNDRNIEALREIKLANIHFAFDRWQDKEIIEPRLRDFIQRTGYNKDRGRVMCYILVNYDTTLEQDLYRIQLCRELYISPYPMIYDKEHAKPIYKKLQRWCNNTIFWRVPTFEEYQSGKGG